MASLNEISAVIADKLGKPLDFMLKEELKFSIINFRAMFIRQDYSRNGRYNSQFNQDLGCVPMEKTDASECCTLESGCNVYRTVDLIPRPVRLKGLEDFAFVGSIDKTTRFTMAIPEEANFIAYNKYTSLDSRYYYMNDRVYVINSTPSHINIRGAFSDPREAERFNPCEGADCYTDDSKFPLPEDMIPGIIDSIIRSELRILQNTDEGKEIKADS